GLTISFLLSLIDASLPMQMALENGSVTTLTYEKGTFTIQGINDSSYIEKGKKIAEKCRLL
ncbi:MAG: histidine phosphatase family protein, partial [Enterococcus faecalis]|nr:histidine phosphatase family protein [Enterococcus faecalis]